jgi:hypothetical protein
MVIHVNRWQLTLHCLMDQIYVAYTWRFICYVGQSRDSRYVYVRRFRCSYVTCSTVPDLPHTVFASNSHWLQLNTVASLFCSKLLYFYDLPPYFTSSNLGLVKRLRKNGDESPFPLVRYLLQLCTPREYFEFRESHFMKRYRKWSQWDRNLWESTAVGSFIARASFNGA